MIVAKRVRAKDAPEVQWVHCIKGGKMKAESIGPNLTVGGGEKKMFGKSEQHRAMPFAYEILEYHRSASTRESCPSPSAPVRFLIC
jgi:hypothetical protein